MSCCVVSFNNSLQPDQVLHFLTKRYGGNLSKWQKCKLRKGDEIEKDFSCVADGIWTDNVRVRAKPASLWRTTVGRWNNSVRQRCSAACSVEERSQLDRWSSDGDSGFASNPGDARPGPSNRDRAKAHCAGNSFECCDPESDGCW